MFMLSMGAAMDFAFPDVCNTPTPVGPVPIPYPNISVTAVSAPVVSNVTLDCMPALNLTSKGEVSFGDQAGSLGGVVDGDIGGATNYIVGCATINVGGAPAQRLTSVTGQNAMGELPNAPGVCLSPSQTTTLALG